MRGATKYIERYSEFIIISTHTPHAGRDATGPQGPKGDTDFNSHAPCGARLLTYVNSADGTRFQLTRPMRGATATPLFHFCPHSISTHTPHAGRDSDADSDFKYIIGISTHTPHAGRDCVG